MTELPEGWGLTSLGQLMVERASSLNPAQFPDEEFELYSIPANDGNGFDIVRGAEIGSSKRLVAPRDVMVSKIVPHIRRSRVVGPARGHRQIASTEWITFRSTVLDPMFLRYFLISDDFHDQFMTTVSGVGGSLMRAQPARAKRIPVPIPPLDEQRRIVAILEDHLAHLDAAGSLISQARMMIDALITNILLYLIPDVQHYPNNWLTSTVGDAGKVELGRQRHPDWHTGPDMHPYLRVANVFEDRLDLSDVMHMHWPEGSFDRFKLHPGDVLLNEGQSPQFLGRPAIYLGDPPDVAFTNSLIRFQASGNVLPDFALLVFRRHMRAGRFISESRITTNIAHLSAGRLKSVEFPIPPLAEQQKLITLAKVLLQGVQRLSDQLIYLSDSQEILRRSLLAAAFRGDLTADRRAARHRSAVSVIVGPSEDQRQTRDRTHNAG